MCTLLRRALSERGGDLSARLEELTLLHDVNGKMKFSLLDFILETRNRGDVLALQRRKPKQLGVRNDVIGQKGIAFR